MNLGSCEFFEQFVQVADVRRCRGGVGCKFFGLCALVDGVGDVVEVPDFLSGDADAAGSGSAGGAADEHVMGVECGSPDPCLGVGEEHHLGDGPGAVIEGAEHDSARPAAHRRCVGGAPHPGDQHFASAGQIQQFRCRCDADVSEQVVELFHLMVGDGQSHPGELQVGLGSAAQLKRDGVGVPGGGEVQVECELGAGDGLDGTGEGVDVGEERTAQVSVVVDERIQRSDPG